MAATKPERPKSPLESLTVPSRVVDILEAEEQENKPSTFRPRQGSKPDSGIEPKSGSGKVSRRKVDRDVNITFLAPESRDLYIEDTVQTIREELKRKYPRRPYKFGKQILLNAYLRHMENKSPDEILRIVEDYYNQELYNDA